MNKRPGIVLLSFFSLFLLITAAHALEFSADTVMTTQGQKMSGKVFAKDGKFRMEMTKPQEMISISRMDKKVAWSIFPSERMYMEMPLDPNQIPKTEVRGEIERKQVGTETVDGHPAKKYLVTYKEGGKTSQVHQWMATDINFPVKTAAVNNEWVQEFRNVRTGSQPDSLFEVPAGYKKMQIPGMPGGMPKMPGR